MAPDTNPPANNTAPQNSEVDVLFREGSALFAHPDTVQAGIAKLKLAAQQGHAEANSKLGRFHYFGIPGLPINRLEAFKYLELVHNPTPHVQYLLGSMLFFGDEGIEKNEETGCKYILDAAEGGDLDAQLQLAMLLRQEYPFLSMDREWSKDLIVKAANKGHAASEAELGRMFFEGEDVDANPKEAAKFFESAAQKGNMEAKYHLATMLRYGDGIERDEKRAAELLHEIVDVNYPLWEAYSVLGRMYRDGAGVPQDPERGYELIKRSADNGDAAAMYSLIEMLKEGIGVDKNVEASIPYYEQLIKQGSNTFRLTLGLMYLKGDEIQQNTEQGLKLLQEYGENGGKDEFYELGVLFSKEEIVPIDEKLAVKYLEEAVKLGHPDAPYNLGVLRVYQAEGIFLAIESEDLEARYQVACIQMRNYIFGTSAVESLILCADSGHAGAQFKLWWDNLVPEEKAWQYLQKAGENNFEPALMALARIYKEGKGVEQDDEIAEEYDERAAQERNKYARIQTTLPKVDSDDSVATAAISSDSVATVGPVDSGAPLVPAEQEIPVNIDMQIEREAEEGNVTAQLQLGLRRLFEAEMAFQDTPPGSEFYLEAQYNLACIRLNQYKTMYECRKNRADAIEIMINCADLGLAEAKFKLWNEQLVDTEEAFNYLQEAADQGYGPALCELARLYETGRGVNPDYEIAKSYYQRAVEQNVKYAQYRLANMYNYGWGVNPEPKKAKELYALAAAQDFEPAKFELALLNINLDDETISASSQKAMRPIGQLFNEWLKPLNLLCKHLNSKDTAVYKDVKIVVNQLYTTLERSGKKYFAHMPINEETINNFKLHCEELIIEHQHLFETHRGWHTSHWLLKWCVGFLACLTVLPAAYIYFKTEGGVTHTFFSSQLPQTATATAIDKMAEDLAELKDSLLLLNDGGDKPASGGRPMPSIAEEDDDQPDNIPAGPK